MTRYIPTAVKSNIDGVETIIEKDRGPAPARSGHRDRIGGGTAGIALAAALALAACNANQIDTANKVADAAQPLLSLAAANPKVAQIVAVVCKYDAIAQPIVVSLAAPVTATVVPAAAPAVAGAVALDQTVIHPLVLKACPPNSTPVAGVPTVAPVATPTALNGVKG